MDDLEKRVQRIEEEIKKVKRSRTIWLSLAAAILLVAFQNPSSAPKRVEAQEFRLVDETGRLRGHWGQSRADRQGTSLEIWDWRGGGPSEVVRIQSYEGGGEIEVKGGVDHGMVRLSAANQGGDVTLSTSRLIPNGGMLYERMATIAALPDKGRIELFEAQFEEPPEGGLSVLNHRCIFHAPEAK